MMKLCELAKVLKGDTRVVVFETSSKCYKFEALAKSFHISECEREVIDIMVVSDSEVRVLVNCN